jgi:hypothetical protein
VEVQPSVVNLFVLIWTEKPNWTQMETDVHVYIYIYIYIYIYTNVNPCITCTKRGGTEKNMMHVIDKHEPAFFEQPFRTQATNAPLRGTLIYGILNTKLLQTILVRTNLETFSKD